VLGGKNVQSFLFWRVDAFFFADERILEFSILCFLCYFMLGDWFVSFQVAAVSGFCVAKMLYSD